jgi:hypothetical protein
MKITINTEVLKKQHLTMGEFLVMLIGYYDVKYKEVLDKLVEDGIVHPNVFVPYDMVLSNKTKNRVASILLESDEKATDCGIDFESLAEELQEIYPEGNKPGTTYSWRDETEVIAQKLRTLVVKYDFTFTKEEAIQATKEYVSFFKDKDTKNMQLLKYLILKTRKSEGGSDVDSMFMSLIEKDREYE